MKERLVFLLIMITSAFVPVLEGSARELEREEIFKTLQEGAKAQMPLSWQQRPLAEVEQILKPYFTEEAMSVFLGENVYEKDGKYFAAETTFALYYIPLFTYTGETKIIFSGDRLIVYEFFPAKRQGPVTYESHYQGVSMIQEAGQWKVSDFYYSLDGKEFSQVQMSVDSGGTESVIWTGIKEHFTAYFSLAGRSFQSFVVFGKLVIKTFLL